MCLLLVVDVAIELNDTIQFSTHTCISILVIPFERTGDPVLMGFSKNIDIKLITVVHQLVDLHIAYHCIGRRSDMNNAIRVPRTIIGK